MITENLSTFKIHKLSQKQYDKALADGNIDETALYLVPEDNADVNKFLDDFIALQEEFLTKVITNSGTTGDCSWKLYNTGTLVISGNGKMGDYDHIDEEKPNPWSDYSVTKVIIRDGVTSIGEYAFSECSNLTSITIGDSVTSIGKMAFSECDSLTSITIPNSVRFISDAAFYGCSSLKNVYITDIAVWCNIDFFGTQFTNPLSYNANLYLNGELVTDLIIPNSVTTINSYAFSGCKSLTNITIPDSITNIGYGAFSWCNNLTNITIPDSVTSIDSYAFDSCNNLTSVTIGDGVTRIGESAFEHCDSLTVVNLGDSVASIEFNAFFKCKSLTTVNYKGSETDRDSIIIGFGNYPLEEAEWNYIE